MVLRQRRRRNTNDSGSSATGQQQQQRRQKYIRNDGRIVVEHSNNNFSWLRCVVVLSIMTYLVVTNPANYEYLHSYYSDNNNSSDNNNESNTLNSSNEHANNNNNNNSVVRNKQTPRMRKTTNYGLFCIQEKTSLFRPGVIIHMAGYTWTCDYDEPDIGSFLCQDLFQKHMTHTKPILYDPNDIVYTLYRITIWFVVLGHLYGFCHFQPIPSRRLLRHSMKSIFFDNDNLLYLPVKLYQLLIFLYPMLQNMDTAIQHQDSGSIFAVFDSTHINLVFSYVVLAVSAILLNALSKLWSGWFLLKFDAFVAVILGYGLRYTQDTKHGQLHNILFVEELGDQYVSWTTVSWMSLFLMLFFHRQNKLSTAIFWVLCHFAGQTLADYHIFHLVHANFGKSLMFGNSVQDAWLGVKYLVLSPLQRR